MSELHSITAELDQLLGTLEGADAPAAEGAAATVRADAQPASSSGGDAIDRERGLSPRVTQVRGLADAPEVEAFRQALIDGLISADTANQLLQLLNRVVVQWLG